MALPDDGIENQLIDEEDELRDSTAIWDLPDPPPRSPVPPPPPTPMENASRKIGETLQDMADKHIQKDDYSAVDRIIGKDPERYSNTLCTPDCPNRRKSEHQVQRHLIADVRPPVKERLAIAEHEIDDLNMIVGSHQEMILQAATRDNLKDVGTAFDRRIDHMHLRLDRDVFPAIAATNVRIDGLSKRRVLRDWGTGITLTLSIIYSVITTYLLFTRG